MPELATGPVTISRTITGTCAHAARGRPRAAACLVAAAVGLPLAAPGQAIGQVFLTHNADPDTVRAGVGVACDSGLPVTSRDLTTARTFVLGDFGLAGDLDVSAIRFGVELLDLPVSGEAPVEIRLFEARPGEDALGEGRMVGSAVVTLGGRALEVVEADVEGTIAEGNTLRVEVIGPDLRNAAGGLGGGRYVAGANSAGQTAPFFVRAPDCEVPDLTDLADLGLPDTHGIISVLGEEVFRCRGGFFGRQRAFPADVANAGTIIAADFNGDGAMDLATERDTGVGFVVVLLGDGRGGLGTAVEHRIDLERPFGLAAGDVNGDGNLDIVSANRNGPDLGVLLGDGAGGFTRAAPVPLDVENTFDSHLADLDGDGMVDLLATDRGDDKVVVFPGRSGPGFGPPIALDGGDEPVYVTTGDVDGDGVLDVVFSNQQSADIGVYRGDGRLGFTLVGFFPATTSPHRPALGDLDGDGDTDLASAGFIGGNLAVLLNDGTGRFSGPELYDAGVTPRHARIADLNGDDWLDVMVADSTSDEVAVFFGRGDGTLREAERFTAGARPADALLADITDDGLIDIVSTNVEGRDVRVLVNGCEDGFCRADFDGDGALTVFDFLAFQSAFDAEDPRADLDGDGALTIFDFLAFQGAFDAGCP